MKDQTIIFDEQLEEYRDRFDEEYLEVLKTLKEKYELKKLDFDKTIMNTTTTFEDHFKKSIGYLYNYCEDKQTELQQFEKQSEELLESYMAQQLLEYHEETNRIIDAIPEMCEKATSFIYSRRLRDEAIAYKLKLYKSLIQISDSKQEFQFMNSVYKLMSGGVLPSKDSIEYLPIMFKIGALGLMQSVTDKSQLLESVHRQYYGRYKSKDKDIEGAKDVFQVVELNRRTSEKKYVMDHTIDMYPNIVLSLILNKYRECLPYVEPKSEMNREFFPVDSNTHKFRDNELMENKTYYSVEGFRKYISRFVGVFVLKPKDTGGFVCDLLHMGDLEHTKEYYYPLGCYFETDSNFEITEYCFPETRERNFEGIPSYMQYMRIVTTINVHITVAIHLGLQHLVFADDWNYLFYKHVETIEPFHHLKEIISPLTSGVAETVDMANLVLANENEWNYLSVMTGLTSKSIIKLVNTYKDTPLLVEKRLSRLNTPLTKTLGLWSDVFERFCRSVVAILYNNEEDLQYDEPVLQWLTSIDSNSPNDREKLERTLCRMYMNTVAHEILSNPQLLEDTLENKLVFSVRKDKDTGLPSAWVHLRTIGTAMSTSGDAFRLIDESLANKDSSYMFQSVFDTLYQDLLNIASIIETDPKEYSMMIHPKNVESSIAW